jgi:hypothetical protein
MSRFGFGSTRTSSSSSINIEQEKINNDILYNIVTNNFERITQLVTVNNINNIIDKKNDYTALHYAIFLNNNKLLEFLLNLKPNFLTKSNSTTSVIPSSELNIYDFALKHQNMYIFDYILKKKSDNISSLNRNIECLTEKINDIESNNKYLLSNVDKSNIVIKQLRQDISDLKIDLSYTKSLLLNSDNAYNKTKKEFDDMRNHYDKLRVEIININNTNESLKINSEKMNSENKSLKRKLSEEQEAYTGLLTSIKKKK